MQDEQGPYRYVYAKVKNVDNKSQANEEYGGTAVKTDVAADSNLVTSIARSQAGTHAEYAEGHEGNIEYLLHAPVIDIDFPIAVIPSAQLGHNHLFINKRMTWARYKKLLKALWDAGIIEEGYYKASLTRGFTAVRTPGIAVKDVEQQPELKNLQIELAKAKWDVFRYEAALVEIGKVLDKKDLAFDTTKLSPMTATLVRLLVAKQDGLSDEEYNSIAEELKLQKPEEEIPNAVTVTFEEPITLNLSDTVAVTVGLPASDEDKLIELENALEAIITAAEAEAVNEFDLPPPETIQQIVDLLTEMVEITGGEPGDDEMLAALHKYIETGELDMEAIDAAFDALEFDTLTPLTVPVQTTFEDIDDDF